MERFAERVGHSSGLQLRRSAGGRASPGGRGSLRESLQAPAPGSSSHRLFQGRGARGWGGVWRRQGSKGNVPGALNPLPPYPPAPGPTFPSERSTRTGGGKGGGVGGGLKPQGASEGRTRLQREGRVAEQLGAGVSARASGPGGGERGCGSAAGGSRPACCALCNPGGPAPCSPAAAPELPGPAAGRALASLPGTWTSPGERR